MVPASPGSRAAAAALFKRVKRWTPIAAIASIAILAFMLPLAIFLTAITIQWVAFLVGVLVAASLALASRASRSRWLIARRTAQLQAARARLAPEAAARALAQQRLAEADARVQLIDRTMPLMLLYVDAQRAVRFHNRAFEEWAGKPAAQVEASRLPLVVGAVAGAEMEERLATAFTGRTVCCEHRLAPAGGEARRVAAQYAPHFGDRGEVPGVFVTLLEMPSLEELAPACPDPAQARRLHRAARPDPGPPERGASERIAAALAQDDFSLYLQRVVRINPGSSAPELHEVLLRLDEEEDYHLPPGAFFSLAEECGMLPALDAWQVGNVVRWLGADAARGRETCAINVSATTLADGGFAGAVRAALREHRVAGRSLCFGICADELEGQAQRMLACIRELKRDGCRFALTGFGRGRVALKLVRELEPDYLRIDGGIVLGLARDPRQAARVAAINRVAHAIGAATIAECVEDRGTLARLTELGVDFAQGSAISMSVPMRTEPGLTHPTLAPGPTAG